MFGSSEYVHMEVTVNITYILTTHILQLTVTDKCQLYPLVMVKLG
jgi:hypothetical protein